MGAGGARGWGRGLGGGCQMHMEFQFAKGRALEVSCPTV